MTGIVKSLIAAKGYGFIKSDHDAFEYFFHRDDFTGHWDDLSTDFEAHKMKIPVEFDVSDKPTRGPRAANVRRLDYPNQAV